MSLQMVFHGRKKAQNQHQAEIGLENGNVVLCYGLFWACKQR